MLVLLLGNSIEDGSANHNGKREKVPNLPKVAPVEKLKDATWHQSVLSFIQYISVMDDLALLHIETSLFCANPSYL